jgi:uncharacterized protein with HEPN domain
LPLDPQIVSRLIDMRDNARRVIAFVAGQSLEAFESDEKTRYAVERAVEIIGEAARGLPKEFIDAHPQTPWVKIIKQRHVISHDYGDIDVEILYRVATTHVPALLHQLEAILDAA